MNLKTGLQIGGLVMTGLTLIVEVIKMKKPKKVILEMKNGEEIELTDKEGNAMKVVNAKPVQKN